MSKTILITGSAGFIGFHLSKYLLSRDYNVIGIDNLNDYYEIKLKIDRNNQLKQFRNYTFYNKDICEYEKITKLLSSQKIDMICHLAAQAGVRYSLKNPFAYSHSNLNGFVSILELARKLKIESFVFASSSSVYGNSKMPLNGFSEKQKITKPVSLYAATKISNELLAYSYHSLYGINTIGLRFFTVYGEYGRPDMAYFGFTKNIFEENEIKIFNNGVMLRDFTNIRDIVPAIEMALINNTGYEIYNLGCSSPVKLNYFIDILEKEIGKKAKKLLLPMQLGDVYKTYANIEKAQENLNFNPKVSIEEGLKEFVKWYKEYYSL